VLYEAARRQGSSGVPNRSNALTCSQPGNWFVWEPPTLGRFRQEDPIVPTFR
jgi:hypothetical protein